MIEFKPVRLEDKQTIERYLAALNARCLCANVEGIRGVEKTAVVTMENGLRVGLTGIITPFVTQFESAENMADITVPPPGPHFPSCGTKQTSPSASTTADSKRTSKQEKFSHRPARTKATVSAGSLGLIFCLQRTSICRPKIFRSAGRIPASRRKKQRNSSA